MFRAGIWSYSRVGARPPRRRADLFAGDLTVAGRRRRVELACCVLLGSTLVTGCDAAGPLPWTD